MCHQRKSNTCLVALLLAREEVECSSYEKCFYAWWPSLGLVSHSVARVWPICLHLSQSPTPSSHKYRTRLEDQLPATMLPGLLPTAMPLATYCDTSRATSLSWTSHLLWHFQLIIDQPPGTALWTCWHAMLIIVLSLNDSHPLSL